MVKSLRVLAIAGAVENIAGQVASLTEEEQKQAEEFLKSVDEELSDFWPLYKLAKNMRHESKG